MSTTKENDREKAPKGANSDENWVLVEGVVKGLQLNMFDCSCFLCIRRIS